MEHPAHFPPMTAADAEGIGFKRFNDCPHLTIGRGGARAYDSRKSAPEAKPSIAVILLEPARVAATAKDEGEGEG